MNEAWKELEGVSNMEEADVAVYGRTASMNEDGTFNVEIAYLAFNGIKIVGITGLVKEPVEKDESKELDKRIIDFANTASCDWEVVFSTDYLPIVITSDDTLLEVSSSDTTYDEASGVKLDSVEEYSPDMFEEVDEDLLEVIGF